jgi:broad specificity phosphatase PhoE
VVKLVLVKHAPPEITPEVASHRWVLSAEAAVRALQAEACGQIAAVVTHGTVLTTLVARYNPVPAFAFWDSLTVPACVVLDGATFRLDGPARNFPA